jgi:hypothetical protein
MRPVGSRVILMAVLALGAATGCTHVIPLTAASLDRPPGAIQAPVAVGVYYSPEFRTHEQKIWRGGDRWDFALGEASVRLLDRAWPMIFESSPPVPSRPPMQAGQPKLAAVIEPKIEAFDFSLPFLKTGTYTAEITYRMTLYSPEGESLVSWTVRGQGAKSGQMGFEFARWPGEAADLAMQDAATKFITGFRDVPEVRAWLRRLGVPGSSWAPRWLRAAFGGER